MSITTKQNIIKGLAVMGVGMIRGATNFFPKNDLINFARQIIWSPDFD